MLDIGAHLLRVRVWTLSSHEAMPVASRCQQQSRGKCTGTNVLVCRSQRFLTHDHLDHFSVPMVRRSCLPNTTTTSVCRRSRLLHIVKVTQSSPVQSSSSMRASKKTAHLQFELCTKQHNLASMHHVLHVRVQAAVISSLSMLSCRQISARKKPTRQTDMIPAVQYAMLLARTAADGQKIYVTVMVCSGVSVCANMCTLACSLSLASSCACSHFG